MMQDPSENETAVTEFSANDIFFECPRCGKSMGIDRRGAGKMVTCPDCDLRFRVPLLDQATEDIPPETAERMDAEEAEPEAGDEWAPCSISAEGLERIFEEIASIQGALDRLVDVLENRVIRNRPG
jgi:transcription elongation factor Elf1